MKKRINEPVYTASQPSGVSESEWRKWVPLYLTNPRVLEHGVLVRFLLALLQLPIQTVIYVFLRPPKGVEGELNLNEVRELYDGVSPWYKIKHHLTTRWFDDLWRNLLAQATVNFARSLQRPVEILDLCCGTGLAIEKIKRTFAWWGLTVKITGLDYSPGMLAEATKNHQDVGLCRGNAMAITSPSAGMTHFPPNTFDMVTTMFGQGGIEDPHAMADGVLRVLRPGGQWFTTDMHEPLAHQPAKWNGIELPSLEAVTYAKTTIPLALKRLWCWRDTTRDFYELPLVTYVDDAGQWWGFRVVTLEIWSQPWWLFHLPVMPVAKLIVEKTCIPQEEADKRALILETLRH